MKSCYIFNFKTFMMDFQDPEKLWDFVCIHLLMTRSLKFMLRCTQIS
jgi:hypothetical protein